MTCKCSECSEHSEYDQYSDHGDLVVTGHTKDDQTGPIPIPMSSSQLSSGWAAKEPSSAQFPLPNADVLLKSSSIVPVLRSSVYTNLK